MAAEKCSPGSLVGYVDSDYSERDIEFPNSSTPKRPKVQWQETLIALIAAQQDQLAQLSRQSNTTPSATRSVDTAHDMTSHTTSFRLAEFNPDTANYPMEEWLRGTNKIEGRTVRR
jgi:hypothetical protein